MLSSAFAIASPVQLLQWRPGSVCTTYWEFTSDTSTPSIDVWAARCRYRPIRVVLPLSGFAILIGGEINFLLGELKYDRNPQSSTRARTQINDLNAA